MSELYEKSLLKLELDQVLQLLSQCAGSFGGKEIMDMIWSGVTCVIWEVVLVAISCLFINTMAAFYFDAKGERRQTPNKAEKER